ncbi:hypothetical protein J6590_070284 [Homalodisca vitripennis]|nr:hypothetical protein J6590_070284 [Homalodisca vitripennis]
MAILVAGETSTRMKTLHLQGVQRVMLYMYTMALLVAVNSITQLCKSQGSSSERKQRIDHLAANRASLRIFVKNTTLDIILAGVATLLESLWKVYILEKTRKRNWLGFKEPPYTKYRLESAPGVIRPSTSEKGGVQALKHETDSRVVACSTSLLPAEHFVIKKKRYR